MCLLGLQGNVVEGGDVSGALCLSQAWPGMARTIYGDHQRFLDAYFKAYPGEPAAVDQIVPSSHTAGIMVSEKRLEGRGDGTVGQPREQALWRTSLNPAPSPLPL